MGNCDGKVQVRATCGNETWYRARLCAPGEGAAVAVATPRCDGGCSPGVRGSVEAFRTETPAKTVLPTSVPFLPLDDGETPALAAALRLAVQSDDEAAVWSSLAKWNPE